MNEHAIAWAWLFAVVTSALLLAPMVPAWREWAFPTDQAPLDLAKAQPNLPVHTTELQRLSPHTRAAPSVVAKQCIEAMVGCQFQMLSAPRIAFGTGLVDTPIASDLAGTQCVVLKECPNATPWGDGGWRVEGDCSIPASHQLSGSLVVTGNLSIEHDCLIEGSIKAHGDIRMAPRTQVTGAVIGGQDLWLGRACRVHGPVVCQNRLSMGPDVVLGQAAQPTSVDAAAITAESGAIVYGSVWARRMGTVV